ncbi:glycosyltransferase family 2 protein [Aureispira anguillae]|uniref:Glycosyltransferase family 2 protein n=1 Tax=Aureispira anguillae TaxID=2864201 RepID=A0A915YBY3_9BACT|nr:glycosyltransferase family A protein [Aureispira anguillae]BDS10246.1 glycosyltransferase family 2 protein [Aureispira anguillae]
MQLSVITATHHRAKKLAKHCLPSLLKQTNTQFEWVVINDGACPKTQELVQSYQDQLSITYIETTHQGLIAARNLGLDQASSELICFLDDDNSLAPSFIADMVDFFAKHKEISMCTPIRRQRRDSYRDGLRIKTGKEFFRPSLDAIPQDFVQNLPKAWFDSNGFTHRKQEQIRFNPNTLIMSDYEYLLQCFSIWGLHSLAILPKELVLYIQTNEGIIGQSTFSDWLKEFEFIQQNSAQYSIFELVPPEPWLSEQIETIRSKAIANKALPGFAKKPPVNNNLG